MSSLINRRMSAALVLVCVSCMSVSTAAKKEPWEEYDKLISARKTLTQQGPDLFGDHIDLATGALQFSATDAVLPGNSALPVAVTRKFDASSKGLPGAVFGDWQIDIPNISGLFSVTWHNDRCDKAEPPGVPVVADPDANLAPGRHYWKGTKADMPGGGELLRPTSSTNMPTAGGPYVWTTSGRVMFSCLASVNNAPGQGFFALAPDGTKYWFNHMAQYVADPHVEIWQVPNRTNPYDTNPTAAYASDEVPRRTNVLYATRVEDRFGNWVAYNYSNTYDRPLKINSITSSDGRSITFRYNGSGLVDQVVAGTQLFQYIYGYATRYSAPSLSQVLLPDGSSWKINFSALSSEIEYAAADTPNWRTCFRLAGLDPMFSGPFVGTITHPSGAVGTFETAPQRFGRTKVPALCRNYVPSTASNNYNDPTNDYAIFPINWHAIALMKKTLSGPSLASSVWTYEYSYGHSWFFPDGQTEPYKCDSDTCAEPICVSDDCAGSGTTTIIGPDGWKRYTFGNSYRYNEGKLLKIEEGADAANILRVTTKAYELAQVGRPYPTRIGTSPLGYLGDGFTAEFPRPEIARVINQQDASFNWQVDRSCYGAQLCLDANLRPVKEVRSSSRGYQRIDETSYHDNTALWVLGQTARTATSGIEVSRTDYNAQALPERVYGFGKLEQTMTYDSAGRLSTAADGRGNTTRLSDWKRGIPQLIQHPDGTQETASVDDMGWIRAVTNEAGSKTCYGYDAMGRVSLVEHPSESQPGVCDTTHWHATRIRHDQLPTAEYGVPAGSWRRVEETGNARKIALFDGLLRPIVEESFDAADRPTSESWVAKRYDMRGNVTFASYPRNPYESGAVTWADVANGTRTKFDALGRPVQTEQDSEQGVLTTRIDYQPGFRRVTTNPRGFATVEEFQVFDVPSFDSPVLIDGAENTRTVIERDIFGKPKSINRGPTN
ncbi:wall associated protein [Lysobacter humi (ex Lee et al. 2017)]